MAKGQRGGHPPRPTEKDKDRQQQLRIKQWDVIKTIGLALVVGATIVGGLFMGVALPVYYSAGKQTAINFALNWVQNIRLDVWLGWGAAGLAALWAWRERLLRFRERAIWDERRTEMEQQLDPNRTGSGLTPSGRISGEQKDD